MKTRISILLLTGLTFNMAFAATPIRVDDGVVVFAKGTIKGKLVFTQKEIDDYVLISSASADLVKFNPSGFELALSTSGIKFNDDYEFQKAVIDADYRDDKVIDMQPSVQKKLRIQLIELETKAP